MDFRETTLPGVFEITPAPYADERGSFARLYCPDAFAEAGITFTSTQVNLSRNPMRHTLRGLHFQAPPHAEAKLVRAVTGKAFDVVVDLRPDSPVFGQWTALVLCAEAMNAAFIPEGCAHGFLTLEADTDLIYQMGRPYAPGHADGVPFDDPALAIAWPAEPAMIGETDRAGWPAFTRARFSGFVGFLPR